MQVCVFLKKYIPKNFKLWLLGLFVPALASLATNVYFAEKLQEYVMQLQSSNITFQQIATILVSAIFVLLLLSGIDDVGRYVFALFSVRTDNEIKHEIYHVLIHASMKDVQKTNQGELLTRYTTDTEQSGQIISWDLQGIIYPMIVGTGYLYVLLRKDFRIGVIMLVLGIAAIILNYVISNKLYGVQKEILEANEQYVQECNNIISGKMSIRQYSAQNLMLEKQSEKTILLLQKELKMAVLKTWKVLTSDSLANACTYLMTPLACLFAVQGYFNVSVVLFIHQICRCFIMYTQNFAGALINFRMHQLSFARLNSVLDFPTEEKGTGKKVNKKETIKREIIFDHVTVSYGEMIVLKNVTFNIRQGEIVALIGESGSGKSSLVKALLQMVDYSGKISIDGEECKSMALDELRKKISFSPEHSELFDATVYDNIMYGNLAAKEEINSVMKKAAIAEADGFLYRNVGVNGNQLSGGQKQRVSIARALIKDAPIIILDEPTAALDVESEAIILDTIQRLKKEGKIILVITHRMSTLNIADRVMQIKDGEVKKLEKLESNAKFVE